MVDPRIVIALSAVAVPAEGLVRIPVAALARGYKGKQKFAITREMLAEVVRNFRAEGKGEVVIDYDHATEYAAGSGDAVKASGWLKSIEDEPDAEGVLRGWAEFTPAAMEMLRNKEYKYISPVLNPGVRNGKTGEPQGWTLTSLALTNSPVLDKMPAITFSAGWDVDRGNAEKGNNVVTKLILADRAARTARVVMEDGTERTLMVEGLEAPAAPPKVLCLSDVKRTSEGVLDFGGVQVADGTLVAGEVFRAMAGQAELDAAVKAGRITPAQRGFYESMAFSNLVEFRKLVETMKPAVDLTERGLGGGADELGKLDAQIEQLVQAKLVAGGGAVQYHEALKLVTIERPDLAKKRAQLAERKVS